MNDTERLQAAKAEYQLAFESIAKQYGVTPVALATVQNLTGATGIQIQVNPYIDFAWVAGWQPENIPLTGKNEGKQDDES